ncbi:MAG: 6,7-dimethyl-8-ribityllumazine synthase [Planctomycetota bacterium]|nr:MAG: 6,7-dimethyl-8-ribityllumazine synthase [Planctomycetota bacterium]
MAKVLQGRPRGEGVRVGIACARFNEFITKELLRGCVDELERHGVLPEAITVAWVPGSWELPLVCERLAASEAIDAVIALGCVIRGATAHFDYVAGEAAKGVAAASARTGKPVIFGVLTTDTIEQAVERAGTKAGNKGRDAAVAALEMVDLLEDLPE